MLQRSLLWTNIIIAGSAASWVVVTIDVLSLPFDWLLIALAFILALAFYTRDRLDEREQRTDLQTMPERTRWMQQHVVFLQRVVWGGFLGAIGLLLFRPTAVPPILAGLGFALSYTVRWLPWRGQRVGWKHLPAMKMPFVAALWTLLTVITPAVVYGHFWQGRAWLLAAAICALIMVQILLNDLRDIEGDRLGGTVSLPALVGAAVARRVGYLLAIGALGSAVWLASSPLGLVAIYSLFLLWRYRRAADSQWRPFVEGQGLVALLPLIITGFS